MSFSVRKFLRDRQALLIHFSSIMTGHREQFPFPCDLRNAMRLKKKRLSFCTLQTGDHWPAAPHAPTAADANAAGNIGIVVDINDVDSVYKVAPGDQGSFDDGGPCGRDGLGELPTLDACSRSIDMRESCNEWLVKNYTTIGILALAPHLVPRPGAGEGPVSLVTIVESFPELPIFSIDPIRKCFLRFARSASSWEIVAYEDIVRR
jgi:hypothetical protein